MRLSPALAVALAAAALGAAGCGGSDGNQRDGATTATATTNPIPGAARFAYDATRSPEVAAASGRAVGGLRVERVTFAGPRDGEGRIPAGFAIPVDGDVRACLLYQGGIGSTVQDAPDVWQGAASLHLATFTMEYPLHGERAAGDGLEAALRDPRRFAQMLDETVVDLRRALDVVVDRPECKGKRIGYLGESYGGFAGALLSAVDLRPKAVALLVTGGDWARIVHAPGRVVDFPDDAAAVRIVAPYDPERWVGHIAPRPLLLVNGRQDTTVPPAAARALAAAAREPKQAVFYDGGHAAFSGPWAEEVMATVAHFLQTELVDR